MFGPLSRLINRPTARQVRTAALFVPEVSTVDAAQTLDAILRDPKLRLRLGQAGRRRVEDYFAMDRYIARVLTVYEMARERSRRKLQAREAWDS